MTLVGNAQGKLHVQRQVEDYALRGSEFETMGFLTFTVETYEHRIPTKDTETTLDDENKDDDEFFSRNSRESCRYLSDHPKFESHIRTSRCEGHNYLPDIVGPWLPRRDEEENARTYYYAGILAFLKPWRNLELLKDDDESWQSAFDGYMETANQRDRDVVAGCQYYYDSRTAIGKRGDDDEAQLNNARNERAEDDDDYGMESDDESEDETAVHPSVSES